MTSKGLFLGWYPHLLGKVTVPEEGGGVNLVRPPLQCQIKKFPREKRPTIQKGGQVFSGPLNFHQNEIILKAKEVPSVTSSSHNQPSVKSTNVQIQCVGVSYISLELTHLSSSHFCEYFPLPVFTIIIQCCVHIIGGIKNAELTPVTE